MEAFLIQMMIAATPVLLAGLGELVTERSGVLNLGVEGMMLMGAVGAFAAAFLLGSTPLAIVIGAASGALMALIFAVFSISFLANQAATGLALTIFGIGASGLIGQPFVGQPLEPLAKLDVPWLSDATMLGRILFAHDAMVYAALILAAAVAWFLGRTRAGLSLRAVGDNPDSAHALGLSVIRTRYLATLFGGAMAGLGGAYLSIAYTPMWGPNMTAGRGWIALALVVFATWRPGRLVLGAYLFAAVDIMRFYAGSIDDWICARAGLLCGGDQADRFLTQMPAQVLSMLPYLATIVALVLISRNVALTKANAPASIGRPFRPST
ncbi:MAG: ABC transporter permease [Pseudomonadota bacterium]